MESSFENYLAGSDEESFFTSGGGRYGGTATSTRTGGSSSGAAGLVSPDSDSSYGLGGTDPSLLVGGTALGSPGVGGWEDDVDADADDHEGIGYGEMPSSYGMSGMSYGHFEGEGGGGDDDYDFDIDLKKKSSSSKSKSKKKKKKREKEQELLNRKKREEELSKTKEERMQELLGQLNSEREAEREKKMKKEREMQKQIEAEKELERLKREQDEIKNQRAELEEDIGGEEFDSLATDSLEMSSTDFQVGGYQKKKEAAKLSNALNQASPSSFSGHENYENEEFDHDANDEGEEEEEEEDRASSVQQQMSAHLSKGLSPSELAHKLSFGELTSLMKGTSAEVDENGEEEEIDDDDDGTDYSVEADEFDDEDPNESEKEAQDIYASFEKEAKDEEEEEDEEQEEEGRISAVEASEGTKQIKARIKAKLFDWSTYYDGQITQVRPDGLLDILFDDGERVEGVDPSQVEFVNEIEETRKTNIIVSSSLVKLSDGKEEQVEEGKGTMSTVEASSPEISRTDRAHEMQIQEPITPPQSPRQSENSPPPPPPPSTTRKMQHNINDNKEKNERKDTHHNQDKEETPLYPQSPASKVRNLFWEGMGTKGNEADATEAESSSAAATGVILSPPPPPPPSRPPQSSDKVYSIESFGKKTRVIKLGSSPLNARASKSKDVLKIQKNGDKVKKRNKNNERNAGTKMEMVDNQHGLREQIARLRLQESALEAELDRVEYEKQQTEKQVSALEQVVESQKAEIFRLNSEIKDLQSTNAVRASLQNVLKQNENAIPKDQLIRIEKEMAEQDRLLAGYQKENERLVEQLREAEKRADQVRDSMYKANLKLGLDHNNHNNSFNDGNEKRGGNAGSDLRARLESEQAVLALQEQISSMKKEHKTRVADLQEEIEELRKVHAKNDSNRNDLVENDGVTKKLIEDLRVELAQARMEHLTEAKSLKSKLEWYVENQQLLSENEQLIKAQKERIEALERVKFGKVSNDNKENSIASLNNKEKGNHRLRQSLPSDLKRIRTLERQVKELEEALRKRNPDCLANLILAAGPSESEKQTRRELSIRIKELEGELEEKDKSHARRLRTLRQEHERVKLRYEKRLKENEIGSGEGEGEQQEQLQHGRQQNSRQGSSLSNHQRFTDNKEGRVVALEQELVRVREFYRKKLEDLSKKSSVALRVARRENHNVEPTLANAQRDADKLRAANVALEAKVEELQNAKSSSSSSSSSSVSKQKIIAQLKEENQNLIEQLDSLRNLQDQPLAMKKSTRKQNRDEPDALSESKSGSRAKSKEELEKYTQQDDDDDDDGTQLLDENKTLQKKVYELEMHIKTIEKESKNVTSRWKNALKRSESAVSRLHTVNMELQAQVAATREQLDVPMTPSMVQHQALAQRLEDMESKYLARERELQSVVQQIEHRASLDLETEKARHHSELAAKDNQLLKFRLELDTLLEGLRVMQQ